MNKDQILVGRTITGISITEDRLALRFSTTDGDVVAKTDADCCSSTWVEHVELPALGFPAKVASAEDLDLPGSREDDPEHDCLAVYGLKITTDKGEIVIDYRNSSNGYYGGSLTWPGERHYGGVYGQNEPEEKWRPLGEDSK